jgi:SAM-dependent methyltransferase
VGRRTLLSDVERYYSCRFAEHGPSAQGVDWNSVESQELRFAQLLNVVAAEEEFSILDYGCGYGALASFLDSRGLTYCYQGFDLSEMMLEHARQRFGGNGRRSFTSDDRALKRCEYVVASGIFNVRLKIDESDWLPYVLETIERLDGFAARGFAFNMLTVYSEPARMRPDLFYGDPCFFFDMCKRRFSRDVALLHDYGLYDFTILVRK